MTDSEPILPPLNVNRLGYFYAVVRCGSQAAAARELDLAPSSINEQLKRLEAELGQRLFEKRTEGMALTQAGLTCFEHASNIFSAARRLLRAFDTQPSQRVVIRIGIASTVARAYATDMFMPLFERKHLQAQLTHADHHLLMQRLRVGELDMALLDSRPPLADNDRITARVAARHPLVVVGSPPRVAELAQNVTALHDEPFFHLAPTSALRRKIDIYLREAGVVPELIAESEDLDVVREAVIKGHGFAALPHHFVSRDLDEGRLSILLELPLEVSIFIAHFDNELPEAILEVIELLTDPAAS